MKRVLYSILLFFIALPLFAQYAYEIQNPLVKENFRLGVTAFNTAKYGEAILLFEKALANAPRDPLLLFWLGKAYMRAGFNNTALARWKDAVSIKPSIFVNSYIELFTNIFIKPLEQNYSIAITIPGRQKNQDFFLRPSAVFPLPNGNFIVVGHGNNQLVTVNPNGVIIEKNPGNPGGFDRPFSCIQDTEGNYFVTEFQSNRIAKLSPTGAITAYMAAGKIIGPQFIAEDTTGFLYVTSVGDSSIVKLDKNGNFIASFTGKSINFNGLKIPTGIAVHNDRIYVADAVYKSVIAFDLFGNYITEYAKGRLHKPESLLWKDDSLIIADSNTILQLDLASDEIRVLYSDEDTSSRFTSAVYDINGDLLVTDFDKSRILIISDETTKYSGLIVESEKIITSSFPKIFIDVSVRDRYGKPVIGLNIYNFYLTEMITKIERTIQNGIPIDKKNEIIKPVTNLTFEGSLDESKDHRIILIVEASPAIAVQKTKVRDRLTSLLNNLPAEAEISLIYAGKTAHPAVSGDRQEILRSILSMPQDNNWRFDTALKLAVNDLVKHSKHRSIIFITSGSIREQSFQESGVRELLLLLSNNRTSLYAITFSKLASDQMLTYLCTNTQGTIIDADSPLGLAPLVNQLLQQKSGLYRLSFTSTADPLFGQNYLPIGIEVYLRNKSGKEETGYFAPLQ